MSDRRGGKDFMSMHRHGFVRVATSTPRVLPADVGYNRDAIIEEARRADAAKVDLAVFPELCVSSYAIDDLHLQTALLDAVEAAVGDIAAASAELAPVLLIGAPLRHSGRLYNCALAIARGRLLGVVPKSFLPNYREYYEKRWFAHGRNIPGQTIRVAGAEVPFGADLIFEASDLGGFVFHMEICEDFWAAVPPSSAGALAGATILTNLSASNITIGKSDERHLLCRSQSARAVAAYAYSAAGPGESTTDLAWDGQGVIYELGDLLAESERFPLEPPLCIADVDTGRILGERMRMQTFNDMAEEVGRSSPPFRRVLFEHRPSFADIGLIRPIRRFPYVPNRKTHLDQDCYEAFNIQVEGLRRRFEATSGTHMVIGVSGGLDFDPRADRRRQGLRPAGPAAHDDPRLHHAGLRHRGGDQGQRLEADARARRHRGGDRHPPGGPADAARHGPSLRRGRAGLRHHLRERAGGPPDRLPLPPRQPAPRLRHRHGRPVRAGARLVHLRRRRPDEPLRGQCRGAEDADPVPDPLGRADRPVRPCDRRGAGGDPRRPRFLPSSCRRRQGKPMQSTEAKIGPYELHDFFLYHIMRYGHAPSKVAFLALHAWSDAEKGLWPIDFPQAARHAYDLRTIRRWLEVFLQRFFALSQFKRSALPNGPKVSAGGALSPRGDWRAPSDATAAPWLDELRRNVPDA